MTKPTNNNMNESNRQQLTNCQEQIESAMAELRKTLDDASRVTGETPADQREYLEADICLASRSAHFDFYTWVVLHGEIDVPAEAELDQLFQRALAMMRPGRFKDSVHSRYDEFKEECARVTAGVMESQPASSF